ncbi:hypothetical protein GALL_512880 [mine drainage metagenome]|uniref:Uncharacterized protein n=1 Tax=mine drainage metagenome TaxID=410659 RepID=A0A1J5PH66_9ZZZZ
MGKLALDDDGVAVLGNALLLGYLWRLLQRREGLPFSYDRALDARNERRETSERIALREALADFGSLDGQIEGPLDEQPIEPIAESHRRWREALNSNSEIATLRAVDLDIPNGHPLESIISPLPVYDRRTPFAKLGPTAATREIIGFLMPRLRGEAEALGAKRKGGPLVYADNRREGLAADAIKQLQEAQPDARLLKDTCIETLVVELKFARKAGHRIWGLIKPEGGRDAGRTGKNRSLISADDVVRAVSAVLNNPPHF